MGLRNGALAYAPSATTQSGLPSIPSQVTAHRISSTAISSLVRKAGRWFGGMPARSFARTYIRASRGRATTPHAGWVASRPRTTHTCPYTNGPPAGPGVGLWWTPAPWTCRPYRGVGVSSRAKVRRAAPATSGLTTSWARRAAVRSVRFPTAATVV
jgi:hypothetical protein